MEEKEEVKVESEENTYNEVEELKKLNKEMIEELQKVKKERDEANRLYIHSGVNSSNQRTYEKLMEDIE